MPAAGRRMAAAVHTAATAVAACSSVRLVRVFIIGAVPWVHSGLWHANAGHAAEVPLAGRSGRGDLAFAASLAERDVNEMAVGDLLAIGEAIAADPGLDRDGDRGRADALDRGVDAQDIADLDRRDEGHGLDGHGDDAPLGALDRGDGAGDVHLVHFFA